MCITHAGHRKEEREEEEGEGEGEREREPLVHKAESIIPHYSLSISTHTSISTMFPLQERAEIFAIPAETYTHRAKQHSQAT